MLTKCPGDQSQFFKKSAHTCLSKATLKFFRQNLKFYSIQSEWKERHDIKDDNSKDTVSYDLVNRFIFRPDLSNGLTGDEVVTLPHLVMLGGKNMTNCLKDLFFSSNFLSGVMTIKRDREPMLPFIVKAMKSLFHPTSLFVNLRVMDFLFDGFAFNCDAQDFSAKTVCAAIKSEAEGVKIVNETHLSISVLGHVRYETKFPNIVIDIFLNFIISRKTEHQRVGLKYFAGQIISLIWVAYWLTMGKGKFFKNTNFIQSFNCFSKIINFLTKTASSLGW